MTNAIWISNQLKHNTLSSQAQVRIWGEIYDTVWLLNTEYMLKSWMVASLVQRISVINSAVVFETN